MKPNGKEDFNVVEQPRRMKSRYPREGRRWSRRWACIRSRWWSRTTRRSRASRRSSARSRRRGRPPWTRSSGTRATTSDSPAIRGIHSFIPITRACRLTQLPVISHGSSSQGSNYIGNTSVHFLTVSITGKVLKLNEKTKARSSTN